MAPATKKYVLTGVNGGLGSAAADFALTIRKPTDQLVYTTRSIDTLPKDKVEVWKKLGVQLEECSYDDVESMKRVFEGAEAIGFISTWLFGERRQQARNVCDAAKAAGVKRICYTSFVGADSTLPEEEMTFLPRDHRANEKTIRETGLQYNIQRDYLYQDYLVFMCLGAKMAEGRWLSNFHGVPGAFVAREDCGHCFAALLLGKAEPNTIFDITGPDPITDLEAFRWIAAQTGFEAEFVDMKDAELRQWWIDFGMPDHADGIDFTAPEYAHLPVKTCCDDVMSVGETIASGSMRHTTDAVEKLTGHKATPYQVTLMKYAKLFPTPN